MSGHRRVKDISYDEEDYDDYDEDDYDLSPEDREQMRIGTIKVKEALGPSYNIPNKQIEDALWDSYYDVAKATTNLKSTHTPIQSKKQRQESRFDRAAGSAAQSSPANKKNESAIPYPLPISASCCHSFLHTENFFQDAPWGNIPSDRLGVLVPNSIRLRYGLLGGSSKPSKLAALAAARKKKEDEKKAGTTPSSFNSGNLETGKSILLLHRLGNKQSSHSSQPSTPLPDGSITGKENVGKYITPTLPNRQKVKPTPAIERQIRDVSDTVDHSEDTPARNIPRSDLRANPSAFAHSMFGKSLSQAVGSNDQEDSAFMLPYLSDPDFAKLNAFAGPSPDDVVLNAQAKGAKGTKSQSKQSIGKATKSATEGSDSLSVQEPPKVKSKNLNVLEEFEKSKLKSSANFVVIGHVDHGKSTLMGRLLYDLKVVDQRSVDKLRKEAENIGKPSFALAWVMDQTAEERSRGVTVDVATNTFETDRARYTILDAPGHQDFIPNMIAGASQADFAVLVIDSSTNSFESGLRGQTKEHALLARSIGVQRIIVVVNKMDTISWFESRFQEIAQQMSAFLSSAGFSPKNVSFIPCAGLTGENVVLPAPSTASWYTGNTFLQELDTCEHSTCPLERPLRLTVSDIFRGGITNPLSISGRIDAGSLQVGDTILSMPANENATIRAIEIDSESVDWAVAGQIATLHLADIDPVHLRVGDIVCTPSAPVTNIKSFTAKILAFDHVLPMHVDVFRGRLNVPARVAKLLAVLDKATGEPVKKKPRVVQPGLVARVVVELERAMPLEVRERVVLRTEGATVAAGLVEGLV